MAETDRGSTVADIYRRAQAIRRENPNASYKDTAAQLVREYSSSPLPPTYNLTIPEQDERANASAAPKARATIGTIARPASKAQPTKASGNGCPKN